MSSSILDTIRTTVVEVPQDGPPADLDPTGERAAQQWLNAIWGILQSSEEALPKKLQELLENEYEIDNRGLRKNPGTTWCSIVACLGMVANEPERLAMLWRHLLPYGRASHGEPAGTSRMMAIINMGLYWQQPANIWLPLADDVLAKCGPFTVDEVVQAVQLARAYPYNFPESWVSNTLLSQ
jgi:hypothetical protein